MSTYRIHALVAIDGAWVTPIERNFSISSRSGPRPDHVSPVWGSRFLQDEVLRITQGSHNLPREREG
jgi:hypothetical protein